MSEPLVTVEKQGTRAILALNRPEKRNAMNRVLLEDLARAFDSVRDDPGVRVVELRGNGPVFSSGIDHSLLMEAFQASQTIPFRHLHGDMQRGINAITQMEKPVVAVLHGAAVGLGLELALAADFRVATSGCVLGLPEVAFGILPDIGGTTRLTRLVGASRAKELILTGTLITGARGEAIGLVNAAVEGEDALRAAVDALCASLAQHPPEAVGLAKVLIDRAQEVDDTTSLRLEGVYQSILFQKPDIMNHFPAALAFVQAQLKAAKSPRG